jgi:hypothetical protein
VKKYEKILVGLIDVLSWKYTTEWERCDTFPAEDENRAHL